MGRILVAYGSKHGSTAEVAEAIGRSLHGSGIDAEVVDAKQVHSLDGYDAAVVGSAVYMGRWRGPALRLLSRHRRWFAEHPTWLFSSGPVGEQSEDDPDAERWTKPRKVEHLAEEIGARDHTVIGGSVDDSGGFMRRRMAERMPEETRDLRDWDGIDAWARGIAAALAGERSERPRTTGG